MREYVGNKYQNQTFAAILFGYAVLPMHQLNDTRYNEIISTHTPKLTSDKYPKKNFRHGKGLQTNYDDSNNWE